nr:MAG TPA: hypothetical protein [Caudoviricetes sp.]
MKYSRNNSLIWKIKYKLNVGKVLIAFIKNS